MMYRWRTGGIAWLMHRLSGLVLAFYLPLHIWVNHHLLGGPEGYDRVMSFLAGPWFRVMESGLWAVILYHTLNGVRVVLIDVGLGSGVRGQKVLFWVVMGVAGVMWFVGSVFLLAPVLGWEV